MRTLTFGLLFITLSWAACQNREKRREVVPTPELLALEFQATESSTLDDGRLVAYTNLAAGPEVNVREYLASNFASNISYHSIKVGQLNLLALDGENLLGIDSAEVMFRPAGRNDFLPLGYLENPVDSLIATDSVSFSGFQTADFIGSFGAAFAGELQVALFYRKDFVPVFPKSYQLSLEWQTDVSYIAE